MNALDLNVHNIRGISVSVPALVNALAYGGGTVLGVGQAVHLAPV